MKNNKSLFTTITTLLVVSSICLTSCSSTKKTHIKRGARQLPQDREQAVETYGIPKFNKNALADAVSFANKKTSIANSSPLSFNINYSAQNDRDIVLSLNDKTGKWIAGNEVTVKRGTGMVTIQLKSDNGVFFQSGTDFNLLVTIRPLNTNWQETIKKDNIKPFTIK